jgi:hypothetical protein
MVFERLKTHSAGTAVTSLSALVDSIVAIPRTGPLPNLALFKAVDTLLIYLARPFGLPALADDEELGSAIQVWSEDLQNQAHLKLVNHSMNQGTRLLQLIRRKGGWFEVRPRPGGGSTESN